MKQHRAAAPPSQTQEQPVAATAHAGESMAALREELAAKQAAGADNEEEASFMSEMTAGLAGYLRAALVGDTPQDYTFEDPVRAKFQQDLTACDVPATLVRQLQNQNYVQDRFGNALPPQAAEAMLEHARGLKIALETGDRGTAVEAHMDYMLDTISSFTDNGSSSAPNLLHRLGVAWQTPGVAVSPGSLLEEPTSLWESVQGLWGGDSETPGEQTAECSKHRASGTD